ncbi:uncharacterized protein LOC130693405 [Daphnia carinata]|uniref:uncharacterized protein LOC130693405 n=1 Tax=Daphnia carinata TaxID=120202 RepID=UPI0025803C4C|nr:uncharacterized protein LOC130693405 [Daphnia carinata]
MRLSSSFTLTVGTVLFLTLFGGIQSFVIGRNLTILVDHGDSHETTTDDYVDSVEHVHNDSLEIKGNFQLVVGVNQTSGAQILNGDGRNDVSLEVHSVGVNGTTFVVDYDDLNDTHSSEDVIFVQHEQTNQTAEQVFKEFQMQSDLLHVRDELVQKRNAPQVHANPVQAATEGQFIIQHFDIQDDSLEDQLARQIFQTDASLDQTPTPSVVLPSPVSIFDNVPIIGVFGHPASDDLYLVKEYLGDYYFWEIEHELVRDSLLQPVKDVIKLESHSPIKVNAAQFAKFTQVRSLWDDRQQTTTAAV